eukprot:gnl/MRDRNA2_/MRDRNA2_85564_c0_seq1.p1 gnl/MRDRNA2_/MRDRNA2_85564_c0~~gnl/MRDRNA2_/MRDRNA2_85564_c0_seq1.p1  ORF type:complete len:139 (-),score=4.36 gnl/MRDRNA2_/MRDRNA2_85564_c0_seq1:308-724(-)
MQEAWILRSYIYSASKILHCSGTSQIKADMQDWIAFTGAIGASSHYLNIIGKSHQLVFLRSPGLELPKSFSFLTRHFCSSSLKVVSVTQCFSTRPFPSSVVKSLKPITLCANLGQVIIGPIDIASILNQSLRFLLPNR